MLSPAYIRRVWRPSFIEQMDTAASDLVDNRSHWKVYHIIFHAKSHRSNRYSYQVCISDIFSSAGSGTRNGDDSHPDYPQHHPVLGYR